MPGPLRIPAIIEHVGPDYTARCRHPVAAETTGHSAHDARGQLELFLAERLGRPVEVLTLQADARTPWIATAGCVPDDALTEDWLESVAQYRRQFDPPADLPTPSVERSRGTAVGVAP